MKWSDTSKLLHTGITIVILICIGLATTSWQTHVFHGEELPNTAAGQCATAFFYAFNSGSEEMMQAFVKEYRSPSYLGSHPVDERLAHYERLRSMFGPLNPVRVSLNLELQLTLLVDPADTKEALVIRFHLEDETPHHLAYITFSMIDHFDVIDEYVAYVATRAAPVNEVMRESTIRSISESLRNIYIYSALGQRMADKLLENNRTGYYNDLTTTGKLADQLTEDAVSISNDLHIWVEAQNPLAQESTDPLYNPIEELRRENYHFRKVEILPDNIGYIKFDMIHDDEEAQTIVAAALSTVTGCDALIFDLQDNIGGEWGTAALILGYLLPGGTVLGYSFDRDGNRIGESSVPQMIPGKPFDDDIPVYVITSNRTGSAAEGLAYTLKHMGRATIVGEVTRGMAHPSEEVVVNNYFRVSIPFRRSENIITGTDWERTGVIPQIEVRADRALKSAVKDALRQISKHK